MKFSVIISSDHPETVWNAFRLANLMLAQKQNVTVFLNGPAVEYRNMHSEAFPVSNLAAAFVQNGGILSA